MKKFLNRLIFWGLTVFPLLSITGLALPLQLIPRQGGTPSPFVVSPPIEDPKGFWEGTPPGIIETYFPKLPLRLTSPSLRTLRAELLKEKYTPLLKNETYERALFHLLVESGQLNAAADFLADASFPDKEALSLNLLYWAGKSEKACEKVTSLMHTSPSPDIRAQNIFCLYLNGEKERGKIALELLSESSEKIPPLLSKLFDPSTASPLDEVIAQSPFLVTVWGSLEKEISQEDLKKLPPSSLALLANSPKMPEKTRLFANQMATYYGMQDFAQTPRLPQSSPLLQDLLEGQGKFAQKKERVSAADKNILELLDAAAASQRKGEVALLTLILLGETPLKTISPARMRHILKNLMAVGYKKEAEALAFEFLAA